MPSLLFKHGDKTYGLVFTDSATIGRDRENDLVLPNATVSGKHALIHRRDDSFWIQDCGSRNGTWAGNLRLPDATPLPLADGAILRVATICVVYRFSSDLPKGTVAIRRPAEPAKRECPSPVPQTQSPKTRTAERTPASAVVCGVCGLCVEPGEVKTLCPACQLPFHRDCWDYNFGCSAYGCPQVNVLKPASTMKVVMPPSDINTGPAPVQHVPVTSPASPVESASLQEPIPWSHLALVGSVVSILIVWLVALAYAIVCACLAGWRWRGGKSSAFYIVAAITASGGAAVRGGEDNWGWGFALMILCGIGFGFLAVARKLRRHVRNGKQP